MKQSAVDRPVLALYLDSSADAPAVTLTARRPFPNAVTLAAVHATFGVQPLAARLLQTVVDGTALRRPAFGPARTALSGIPQTYPEVNPSAAGIALSAALPGHPLRLPYPLRSHAEDRNPLYRRPDTVAGAKPATGRPPVRPAERRHTLLRNHRGWADLGAPTLLLGQVSDTGMRRFG